MENLDEFRARTAANQQTQASQYRPQLKMLAQAEVSAKMLTGDPQWDRFLSYLQAALEHTQGQADAAAETIANPSVVNNDQIMAAKAIITECNARVDAWNAVISLPKDLIEMGDQATALLDRLPE